jgi:hypothetical protein
MDTTSQPAAPGGHEVTGHRRFAQLIDAIHREAGPDPDELLDRLTQAAVATIPGTAHAGVTIVARDAVRSVGATDDVARVMAELAHRVRQGPAIDAPLHQAAVQITDIETDTRWPGFAELVLRETPVRSMVAMPLFHDDESGALNIYADHAGGWCGGDEDLTLTFGVHAALVVEQRRREKRYRSALANRDTIGQAKGMLMERFKIDSATAFALLARLARDRRESVAAVARRVVRDEQVSGP